MDRTIPTIVSSGTPFERGLHLGRQEAGRVGHAVVAYMGMFRLAGLKRADVYSHAERFTPVIEAYAPNLLEEMRGIAEGSGRDLREIVALNARTELLYGAGRLSECTSIGVTPSASRDGHVRLGQNWDWHPALAGALVVWVVRRDDGPDVLTLTEAGMVGKIGVNATGLALCVNLLTSDVDHAGPAVPMHVVLRRVLEDATTVAEAIEVIAAAPRCTSCNHLLADRSGTVADVEATPLGQRVLYPVDGVLTHTNHCVAADLTAIDRGSRESPGTHARGERAAALAGNLMDERDLHQLLADHETAPTSICLHVDAQVPSAEQGESIASIVFDLTATTLDLSDGPPCSFPYRHLALNEYLRMGAAVSR